MPHGYGSYQTVSDSVRTDSNRTEIVLRQRPTNRQLSSVSSKLISRNLHAQKFCFHLICIFSVRFVWLEKSYFCERNSLFFAWESRFAGWRWIIDFRLQRIQSRKLLIRQITRAVIAGEWDEVAEKDLTRSRIWEGVINRFFLSKEHHKEGTLSWEPLEIAMLSQGTSKMRNPGYFRRIRGS